MPRLEIFGGDINTSLGRYYLTLATVVALTIVAINLVRSPVGRNWMAIRDMDTAAAVIGIPVHRYKATRVLLDEPSMGLAPMIVQEIFEIITQLNQEKELLS